MLPWRSQAFPLPHRAKAPAALSLFILKASGLHPPPHPRLKTALAPSATAFAAANRSAPAAKSSAANQPSVRLRSTVLPALLVLERQQSVLPRPHPNTYATLQTPPPV